MKDLQKLVTGYKAALTDQDKEHYRILGEEGQSPKIMVIGCSDSRVNPDRIFNTAPGELFVVRNVANLVPPYEHDEAYHGTSAALEFAVKGLEVEHIVVMGHSSCGGVRACCDSVRGEDVEGHFIRKWISMLQSSAENVIKQHPDIDIEDLSKKVELEAIRASLNNLHNFPFIQDGIKDGTLMVHGAYFDIREAQLYALDKQGGDFLPVN